MMSWQTLCSIIQYCLTALPLSTLAVGDLSIISLILPFPERRVIGITQSSYSLFTLTSFTKQKTFGIPPFVCVLLTHFILLLYTFFKKPGNLFVPLDWARHMRIHLDKS